ncbi:MAG: hypothetical protein HC906_05905 [Bacteroidales bacterium]|nr:hypothetical protein [Bacteroidales bacterium]
MKNLPGVSKAEGYLSLNDYYPQLTFNLFESSGNLPWIFRSLLLTTLDDYDRYSRNQLMFESKAGYVHYRLDSWAEFNEKLLKSDQFGMQLSKNVDYSDEMKKLFVADVGSFEKWNPFTSISAIR